MANLAQQQAIAATGAFQAHVQAAKTDAALNIIAEVADEVQSVAMTGTPTGGSAVLTTLPGQSVTITGTLAATTSVTALSTTTGLSVGMAVNGTNIPANTTIASINSLTAITLSAAATGSGATPLTFTGSGSVSVPFNCTAGQLQTILAGMPSVGAGNVICTGGPLPGTAIAVTYTANLGSQPLNLMTLGANNLTGGSTPTMTITRTTAGLSVAYHAARLAQAKRVLGVGYNFALDYLATAANSTIQSTDYDANGNPLVNEATLTNDIQFAVNSNWNAFN